MHVALWIDWNEFGKTSLKAGGIPESRIVHVFDVTAVRRGALHVEIDHHSHATFAVMRSELDAETFSHRGNLANDADRPADHRIRLNIAQRSVTQDFTELG